MASRIATNFGLRISLLVLALGGTVIWGGANARPAAAICQYAFQYSPGGDYTYTSGYRCSNTTFSTWQVSDWTIVQYWDTSPAQQYEVGASVYGYDRCGSGAYVYEAGDYHWENNTHWSDWAYGEGYFLDCDPSNPHEYRVHSWHYRTPTSTSLIISIFGGYWYH